VETARSRRARRERMGRIIPDVDLLFDGKSPVQISGPRDLSG
jgi:hypothetical protein